jgi:DNA repair protein RadA/Sms
MAICISIISSYREVKVPSSTAVLGEVGLSGEVRPVSNILARVKELQSMGLKKIIIPKGNNKEVDLKEYNSLFFISHLNEFENVFI